MLRATLFRVCLSVVVTIGCAQFAKAGFVGGFTGNSQMQAVTGFPYVPPGPFPTADGLVNFAVYENTSSDWAADLGVYANGMRLDVLVASGPVDLDAKYVYFYQVVNTNPAPLDDPLTEFQIQRGQFDTGGYLTTSLGGTPLVFNEVGDVPTGPTTNTALGTATTDPLPGNGVPGDSAGSLAATPFTTAAGGVLPVAWNLLSLSYEFEFERLSLPTDAFSAVLFMTSDLPPTYLTGELHDTGITNGDIPSNTPEPGTFLMSFGAVAIGLVVAAGAARNSRSSFQA